MLQPVPNGQNQCQLYFVQVILGILFLCGPCIIRKSNVEGGTIFSPDADGLAVLAYQALAKYGFTDRDFLYLLYLRSGSGINAR